MGGTDALLRFVLSMYATVATSTLLCRLLRRSWPSWRSHESRRWKPHCRDRCHLRSVSDGTTAHWKTAGWDSLRQSWRSKKRIPLPVPLRVPRSVATIVAPEPFLFLTAKMRQKNV